MKIYRVCYHIALGTVASLQPHYTHVRANSAEEACEQVKKSLNDPANTLIAGAWEVSSDK